MAKLRFYHIYTNLGEWCGGVVATTCKEAKKMIFGDERIEDLSWIEFTANWAKGADTNGFEKGIFEDCFEAHKRGIYNSYGESEGCDCCDEYEVCKNLNPQKSLEFAN